MFSMSRKLTKEQVNKRIIERGIHLIGEYLDNKTKTQFQCNCSHIWSAEPGSIMRGRGCPICNDVRLTWELVNVRIKNTGIQLISGYINNEIKSTFECQCGHRWKAKPKNIMTGSGCPKCSNRIRLTKEMVNDKISSRNIVMMGDCITGATKTEFKCNCGHVWQGIPKNIMKGAGCPKCAKYGFNPGKPAWIYILDFGNFIKYGISNNLNKRLYKYRNYGRYTMIFSKLCEDGSVAKNWENHIKHILGGRYVTKEIMPDGWTETLSHDKLESLLATIN